MALLRGEWREAAQANSRNEVCIREILVFCIKKYEIFCVGDKDKDSSRATRIEGALSGGD